MEYTVLQCSDTLNPNVTGQNIVQLVRQYIAQGWEPQGGICYDERNSRFLQAMVRRPQ
jgi:hypothetical protein